MSGMKIGWTQDDIDILRTAIGSGAKRVRIKGEETEFRSLEEMRSLLNEMMQEVHGKRPNYFRTVGVSSGF